MPNIYSEAGTQKNEEKSKSNTATRKNNSVKIFVYLHMLKSNKLLRNHNENDCAEREKELIDYLNNMKQVHTVRSIYIMKFSKTSNVHL